MAREDLSTEQNALWEMVAERRVPGADTAAIERRIWETFGAECAIMFTDLSGFSRRVAEFGIIHFLEVILEHKKLLLPLVAAHGGTMISLEADSFLITFPDAVKALNCALAMESACAQHNVSRPPEEALLLCVGLGFGQVLKIGDTNVWGAEVNAASKLGEDTANSFEILATGSAKTAIEAGADALSQRVSFVPIDFVPPGAASAHRIVYEIS